MCLERSNKREGTTKSGFLSRRSRMARVIIYACGTRILLLLFCRTPRLSEKYYKNGTVIETIKLFTYCWVPRRRQVSENGRADVVDISPVGSTLYPFYCVWIVKTISVQLLKRSQARCNNFDRTICVVVMCVRWCVWCVCLCSKRWYSSAEKKRELGRLARPSFYISPQYIYSRQAGALTENIAHTWP